MPIDTFFTCGSLSEGRYIHHEKQTPTLLVPAAAPRTHDEKAKSKIECGTFGMSESVKARADFGTAKGLSKERYQQQQEDIKNE